MGNGESKSKNDHPTCTRSGPVYPSLRPVAENPPVSIVPDGLLPPKKLLWSPWASGGARGGRVTAVRRAHNPTSRAIPQKKVAGKLPSSHPATNRATNRATNLAPNPAVYNMAHARKTQSLASSPWRNVSSHPGRAARPNPAARPTSSPQASARTCSRSRGSRREAPLSNLSRSWRSRSSSRSTA